MRINEFDVIAIKNIKGIGNKFLRQLLLRKDIISIDDALGEVENYIKQFDSTVWASAKEQAEKEMVKCCKEKVIPLIIGDRNYPYLLLNIPDAPPILYTKGNIERINTTLPVAIIGSREASKYSISIAERLGELFSCESFSVISGLAIGCDAAGHRGVFQNQNGYTVAVLAHGLDYVYPKENSSLAEDIVHRNGCLLSEYPVGTRAFRSSFVQRDRLQSGLSYATILVQSRIKGGSMHTVQFCLSQNRILASITPPQNLSDLYTGNEYIISEHNAFVIDDQSSINKLKNKIIEKSKGIFELPKSNPDPQLHLEF